jgi:hypothetical protein
MEYNDIREELMFNLVKNPQDLMNLCYTNKSMYNQFSSKSYWTNIFRRYNLTLPKINLKTPEDWILSFKIAYDTALSVDKIINYLILNNEIILNSGFHYNDIIPYEIFNIVDFDNKNIYMNLQKLNFKRKTVDVRVPRFTIMYYKEEYILHVTYYKIKSKKDYEEEYIISFDIMYHLLYNFIYSGFRPKSITDIDGNNIDLISLNKKD